MELTFEQLDAQFDMFVQTLRAYHPHCYSISFEKPVREGPLGHIIILSRLPDLKKPTEWETFKTVITIERNLSCWGYRYDDECRTWICQVLKTLTSIKE